MTQEPPAPARVRVYVGVDPGASGGLVALDGDGWTLSSPMPKTDADLLDWFRSLTRPQSPALEPVAFIEKVGGYIGGVGHPGSAMFKFGESYGRLRMALCAAGIPHTEVQPSIWQKALGIASRKKGKKVRGKLVGGESKTQFKNRLKARAQQLFPHVKVTLDVADALLIAHYCMLRDQGKLNEQG